MVHRGSSDVGCQEKNKEKLRRMQGEAVVVQGRERGRRRLRCFTSSPYYFQTRLQSQRKSSERRSAEARADLCLACASSDDRAGGRGGG